MKPHWEVTDKAVTRYFKYATHKLTPLYRAVMGDNATHYFMYEEQKKKTPSLLYGEGTDSS